MFFLYRTDPVEKKDTYIAHDIQLRQAIIIVREIISIYFNVALLLHTHL